MILFYRQEQIQSRSLAPSDSFYCHFHATSFLTQLFAIKTVAVWGVMAPQPSPRDPPPVHKQFFWGKYAEIKQVFG